jgi:long-subunit fatty acid transport protein
LNLVDITGESKGAISAYTIAAGLAVPSHPEITIGAGFNWYTRSLCNNHLWQVRSNLSVFPIDDLSSPLQVIDSTETFDDFSGYNFTLGLLWNAYERQENLLTLGFVCHTPFSAEMDQELVGTFNGVPFEFPPSVVDMDFPLALGAGANYRFSDRLSAALDVEWRDWSEFEQKNRVTGERSSPIEDDTVAVRLGGEYRMFFEGAKQSVLAYRGGVFYDPRPAANDPDPLSLYGLSLGLGWTVKEQFSLDFAYQFRWGDQDLDNLEYDLQEHFLIGSVITYF